MNCDDSGSWIVVVASRDHGGNRVTDNPRQTFLDWLRSNGIDWNPFTPDEVRVDHYRVALPDDEAGCNWVYRVRADALHRLGIKAPEDVRAVDQKSQYRGQSEA